MALETVSYPSIEDMRADFGTPKQEMAQWLSLSKSGLQLKLSGQCEFTLTEARIIADHWRLSLDDLIGRTVPSRPIYTLIPATAAS